MNKVFLNTIGEKVIVKGGGSSGGGSSSKERKDVNFFDYDGTLLYAYTWEQAKNLAELPSAPMHDGMTFKEWNYTLDDIKAQSSDSFVGKADIGACFVDGKGNLIENPNDVIIIPRGVEFIDEQSYHDRLVSVLSIPNTVNTIAYSAFFYCNFKDRVVIPSSVTEWDVNGYFSFADCTSPFVIWDNTRRTTLLPSINVTNFKVEIPEWYTEVGWSGFQLINCIIIVPPSIKTLGEQAVGPNYSGVTLYFLDRNDIPTSATPMIDVVESKYIVPDHLYEEWCRTTNWVGARIIKRSDYGDL